MRLDFDTRLSLAFLFGMLGLVEQTAIQVLIGVNPSPVLTGTFGSIMTATIGVGLLRGASRERDSRDDDRQRSGPTPGRAEAGADDDVQEHEGRLG